MHNPDDFLGWDQVHFTAAMHRAVGNAVTLEILKHRIVALAAARTLNSGQANSLLSKLDAAFTKMADRKAIPVSGLIQAFANEVSALIRAGILTAGQAELLLAGANGIILQP